MNHSSEYAERKYLSKIQKNKVKATNRLLKLEKDREIEGNTVKDIRHFLTLKRIEK